MIFQNFGIFTFIKVVYIKNCYEYSIQFQTKKYAMWQEIVNKDYC